MSKIIGPEAALAMRALTTEIIQQFDTYGREHYNLGEIDRQAMRHMYNLRRVIVDTSDRYIKELLGDEVLQG
jgi:hypothetical protein